MSKTQNRKSEQEIVNTVEGIAARTRDAHSFDAFGMKQWTLVVAYLRGKGYSAEAVEQILRSKHTRWSRDHAERYDGRGRVDDFIVYFEEPGTKKHVDRMLREECGLVV